LKNQIDATVKDIEQTTNTITKIEELITNAKMEKGLTNAYKENYKNDELMEKYQDTSTVTKDKDVRMEKPENCKSCHIF
jgi:hypothetical protein